MWNGGESYGWTQVDGGVWDGEDKGSLRKEKR